MEDLIENTTNTVDLEVKLKYSMENTNKLKKYAVELQLQIFAERECLFSELIVFILF